MITNKKTVIKTDCKLTGEGRVYVEAKKLIQSVSVEVTDGGNFVAGAVKTVNENIALVSFFVDNPEYWSVSHPFLYDMRIRIVYEEGEEEIFQKLGIREIASDKNNILLNGRPFYVRGYIRGIRAHDHADNCKLGEEGYYRKNILQAKKYGFNYIRFHSTIPSEKLFRVADELGILIHIELREDIDEYNNLEEMVHDTERLISVEYIKGIVDELYNHPSLAVYCIGNEIKGNKVAETIQCIRENILKNDTTRLFIDTCAWGVSGRSWVDFDVQHMSYYFPYGAHADMFSDTENLLVVGDCNGNALAENGVNSRFSRELTFSVPLLAHEVCHYTALRDFRALKEKFEKYGASEPWWVEEELKMIEAKNLTSVYRKMYRASKLFQHSCWKVAFEAIRKSRLLSGFHFLQFADTDVYENANGMVDCFDDECFISPDRVLEFNGDRVLLAEVGRQRVFCGEELKIPVFLSDYSESDEKTACFGYELVGEDGKIFASGKMDNLEIRKNGLYKLGMLHISVPRDIPSCCMELRCRLTGDKNTEIRNSWKLWAYQRFEKMNYRAFCSYEKDNVVITDNIEKALAALYEKKNVCLVYRQDFTRHLIHRDMKNPPYAFKATWNRFKPVIWDRGTNYGGLCNKDLLEKFGFCTQEYYDLNYAALTEDCDKIILDDFPVQVCSIISGIDKSVRDRFDAYIKCFHLPDFQYDRTLRNFSYLFEVKVGAGNLLVCGLNLTGLDKDEPSSVAMAHFIASYLHSSDFCPENALSEEAFIRYLRESAKNPVKERIMSQFWQLDDAPVESARFWEESREYIDDGTWGKNI